MTDDGETEAALVSANLLFRVDGNGASKTFGELREVLD